MSDELTPKEQATKDIKAMYDSVALIEELNATPNLDEEQLDRLDLNIRHIEIMLGKPHIKESGEDLSAFEAIVGSSKN
jgi:hypothetical protein